MPSMNVCNVLQLGELLMSSLDALANIFGPDQLVTDEHVLEPMLKEWRDRFFGTTTAALFPKNTDDVVRMIQIIAAHGDHIITQGGNTGLVGGQIPRNKREFILSTKKMNKIRKVNPENNSITAEAGTTLHEVQMAAADIDRLFPLSLASEGSCTVGGNLATNAGGTAVLRYGNMRDLCLGLEFVTADGSIHDNLSGLRKDNTGYDLRHLMVGSEGTLGIITAATLKLFAAPRDRQVVMAGLESPSDAVALLSLAQELGQEQLSMFEIMPRIGIEFVTQYIPGRRDPLEAAYPWYVLVEYSGGSKQGSLNGLMERLMEEGLERGLIKDAAWAQTEQQAKDLKYLREDFSEAQKHAGARINHDISLPVQLIPQFMEEGAKVVSSVCPDARIVSFGHLGDGNLHYNVSQPIGMDRDAYLALWETMNEKVHDLVVSMGGSISAEHGIGVLKNDELARYKNPADLTMMRAIKQAVDPGNLFAPDRILRA